MNRRHGHERGRAAEDTAAAHLRSIGYQIIARNFRGRRGEIDLIARDGPTIVFVEVKARRAGPSESFAAVDARKRRRLVRTAMEYVAKRRLVGVSARFDVVAVTLDAAGNPGAVDVLQHAFMLAE